MSNDLSDPVYKELMVARIKLLLEQPFVGNLSVRLNLVEAPWCRTAATDGVNLYYNREFIKSLPRPNLLFLLAHEVWHLVFDHLGRRGNRDKDVWNMACLAWDTPILMADGTYLPIQQILPGDYVASPYGASKVIANRYSGIKPTKEYNIGDYSVRATSDHKFATSTTFANIADIIKSKSKGFVVNKVVKINKTTDEKRIALEKEFKDTTKSNLTVTNDTSVWFDVLNATNLELMNYINEMVNIGVEQKIARSRINPENEMLEHLTDNLKLYINKLLFQVEQKKFTEVKKSEQDAKVFDLVTEYGSFFANNILTHNCDYVINYSLVNEKIGVMPECGLYDKKYTDEMTSDEVYKLLMKNSVTIKLPLDDHLEMAGDKDDNDDKDNNDGEGNGNGGESDDGKEGKEGKEKKTVNVRVMGNNGPPKLNKDDIDKIRNQLKAAIISTAQQVGAGQVPLGVRRMIKELTEPKLDWRTLLDAHIRSALKDDYDFRRISRRTWNMDAILPAQSNMDRVEVFCAIDASGSTTDEMVKDFLSETKGIMDGFRDYKLDIISFDTEVYNHVVLTPENGDEVYNYKINGGGGTLFECVFEYLKREGIEPHRLVFLTDGYPNSSWGDPDYCDTLFVIHSNTNIVAPYGISAYIEDTK